MTIGIAKRAHFALGKAVDSARPHVENRAQARSVEKRIRDHTDEKY